MQNTDKTILLPQLQRYDQNIKGWADNKFLTKVDTPSLPPATATTLGGVKVGSGLSVTDDGTLSAKTHGSETSITTLITATYDNTGIWNVVCNNTYDVIASWFDNYDRVLALVKSGENSLRPFPQDFVELIKIREGLIVSTPFTIQYVVPSNNPRVRTGMTTTALCQIYFNANGSISFQMGYSKVDQYADATEFTNTVNEDVSMLALKDGGITSAKLADGAVTSTKIANGAIDAAKLANNAVTTNKIVDGAVTATKLASGAVTADKIADGAITADKLASGVGDSNLKAGHATIQAGSKHSFGLWSVAVPNPPGSSSGKKFTINVFYNSSILIISDVQCTPSSEVSMTIEHSKVGRSGINRSGYIAFDSSSVIDCLKLAGQGVNIFETSEAGIAFCFAGLFFTV